VTLKSAAERYQHFVGTSIFTAEMRRMRIWLGFIRRQPGPGKWSLRSMRDGETMISICKTGWCHNPEAHNLNNHHCENLKT
jgi:hypothetical protein